MSAIAPSDNPQVSSLAPKKKANKKKKSKSKLNGDLAKPSITPANGSGPAEDDEDEAQPNSPVVTTSTAAEQSDETADAKTNGQTDGHTNGHGSPADTKQGNVSPAREVFDESVGSNASNATDASVRLEAMSQDREALRAEVEKLRRSLEDIQERHKEELSSVRSELEESEQAKEQAQSQYQNLLGRVNTIKSTLGERLAADRQELSEAKDQIEELETQNAQLKAAADKAEQEVTQLSAQESENSKELSTLRNRSNLSQQNWLREREDLLTQTKHLREEAEAAKEAMGDWEVLAMEERSIREGLADRVAELEDQLSTQRESFERAASERDSQSQAVDGLQRALQEIQEARRVELREMVETTQAQLEALNRVVAEADTRATAAEAAKEDLTAQLERLAPFEKEVKEKNILLGKLRHEAIVLNDHLAKALRFLKKAKPEDNVDRHIVTNYFLRFLALDRSDPKKFQILQVIASLLSWTEEQKEQAGLARPGTAGYSLRVPQIPFHRTPSTPSLNAEFFPDLQGAPKESLAELWTGFLERQAEEGSAPGSAAGGSRSASVSSVVPK
ncbi:hypothetical protein VC83_03816 [Pseudogymnoascus destructans]|uniref:GRIP domain-containing protein n=2 Tax=Pseudogymnoascus destructans TaxID=655981 RepID=L8FT06_PSED2|nr:uncharacterized protein VC83_03816 [Pseudogymnoascus destructans]ELR03598.1 hypothetical protein GMDG_06252 [Pseudogymnoascus destructans 20631-21]OAF59812.1 hypothetical protein VC83_03816 [Pseudogymnoascus destructans]